MNGVSPEMVGRFYYPDFSNYISYYSDPRGFLEHESLDEGVAMQKLATYHDIQQDIIRKAEAKKREPTSSGVHKDEPK
ncbi:MAG TPA: hypothetical protein PKI66_04210 [Methanobacteriaceae archaeon]|nr:hypothetical protein [Methanobacteriaceae archaeon]HNS25326.1 hypothetical protein [Methanobacteriaceae archaeon]